LLRLFDGQRSTGEIQAELERRYDGRVPRDLVATLVRQLDERLVLRSPRFEAALERAAAAFAAQPSRPARHAGTAGYPGENPALAEALASMVRRPAAALRAAPRGLIAPHIDLARGREGYALAYGYLAECEPADLYVVFGTGHQGPSAPVTGLALDWETPLGTVRTSRAFVERVHERIGAPAPIDVFLHRAEHSLEFQVLFLRHVLGDRPFEVAGFLTGALPAAAGDPRRSADCSRLIDALAAAAAETGRRVCWVAGADLAHVGPAFGDADAVEPAGLAQLAELERARLAWLERGDPGAFHAAVEGGGNAERVCGTTPIYLTAALAGGAGALLHYGQAPAPDGSQAVTFCAMAFG
jgi:AmmeMemoRadiSam system protein B